MLKSLIPVVLVVLGLVILVGPAGFNLLTAGVQPDCFSYEVLTDRTASFAVSLRSECVAAFGEGPYTYRWDFGHFETSDADPATQTTSSPAITHRFPPPNTYNVLLLVFGNS